MTSTMSLPRQGNLNFLFQMFSFLKIKHNEVAVFHPTDPDIDQNQFPTEDQLAKPHVLCKEDILSNAPAPRGTCFITRAFVGSDHARDSATRH